MEDGFAKVNLSLLLVLWGQERWGGEGRRRVASGTRKSATRLHAHPIPKHLGSLSTRGEPASFPQPLPLFGAQELESCTVSKKLSW